MTSRFVTKKRFKKKLWHNANLSLYIAFVRNDPHAPSTAGWRLIFSPCGMPACVTLRGTPHSTKGSLVYHSIIGFFSTGGPFSRPARKADIGAARLGRRGINRGAVGRESRPRPRPVAPAARSQSRKKWVGFEGRPSVSAVPSGRREARPATESSSKKKV